MKRFPPKEAVNRAKKFLNDHIGSMYDMEDDWFEGSEDYSFENSKKRYYLYLNVENRGYFTSESGFYSKEEVEAIIISQIQENDKESYYRWDNVIIFDVRLNKVITPKISLD